MRTSGELADDTGDRLFSRFERVVRRSATWFVPVSGATKLTNVSRSQAGYQVPPWRYSPTQPVQIRVDYFF